MKRATRKSPGSVAGSQPAGPTSTSGHVGDTWIVPPERRSKGDSRAIAKTGSSDAVTCRPVLSASGTPTLLREAHPFEQVKRVRPPPVGQRVEQPAVERHVAFVGRLRSAPARELR